MRLTSDDPILVSIVLPTFNGERYLRESVRSCLDQSWTSLEVIVVVDGSTDGSRQILAEFRDPRLRIVDRVENRGLPESLNEGFAHAVGQYLTWTSDDNVYYPNAVRRMLDVMGTDVDADLVYAGYDIIDELGTIVDHVDARDPATVWLENPVGACFLYTRRLAERVGDYRPSVRLIEDYDYWLRASLHFRFASLKETLYGYRQHSQSLTGQLSVFERARASARLKRSLGGISSGGLRKELAKIDIAEAFTLHQNALYDPVPGLAARAILGDPELALNRGVVAITARSLGRSLRNRLTQMHRP